MADRGRDLKIGILSDVSKFDLDEPADQLEQVGDSAKDMARETDKAADELKRLAAMGKDAEKELERLNREAKDSDIERLGDDAKDTAKKVDNAFEKIAASSQSNIREMRGDLKKGESALDEFKDESASVARESATSFSGEWEDVSDIIRDNLANALGGLGPVGAAAGIAAAAGIGFLVSSLEKGAEKANELKDRAIELGGQIADAGGALRRSTMLEDLQEWGYAIADNKSWWEVWQKNNVTNIEKVADAARKAGLDFDDMFKASGGADLDVAVKALDDIEKAQRDLNRERNKALEIARQEDGSIAAVAARYGEKETALRQSREAIEANMGMTEEAIRIGQLSWETTGKEIAALEGLTDALDSVGEAEVERADLSVGSIDKIIEAQEKEIAAKRNFRDNMQAIYEQLGQDGVDYVLEQGENADAAARMLVDAPKEKRAEVVANHKESGRLASEATAEGILEGKGRVGDAAVEAHRNAKTRVQGQGPLKIPMGLNDSSILADAAATRARVQTFYRNNPVTISGKVVPMGLRSVV